MITYFVTYVPGRGRSGNIQKTPHFAAREEAGAEAKRLCDEGSPFAVVVEADGETRTPLPDQVFPRTARVIVRHWIDAVAAVDR